MKLLNGLLSSSPRNVSKSVTVHAILLAYTVIALFPIIVVIINAFKTRKAIFKDPLGLPDSSSFTLAGFEEVLLRSNFGLY